MNHYLLLQKNEPGCPIGSFQGVLLDKYRQGAFNTDYGKQPWYAKPGSEPFPKGLCLVTREKSFGFDIRSNSNFFYVASERFIRACEKYANPFEDLQPITVCSPSGQPVSETPYWVCRFKAFPIDEVADMHLSEIQKEDNFFQRPKKLTLKIDLPQDIFKVMRLPHEINFLFCSQRFFEAAKQQSFRGIEFINMKSYKWPPKRSIEQQFMAFSNGQIPKLPV